MVAFRNPGTEVPLDREVVLVLTRKTLEKLYGPTLANRAQFLADYSKPTDAE
jgi:hypothetical protein